MLRFIAFFVALTAGGAFAQSCTGIDQRDTLTLKEQNALSQHLEKVPYPSGNLWQARRGDRTLTLIGTLHVGGNLLAPIAQRATPHVKTADLLMVEATPEDEKAVQQHLAANPAMAFLVEGPTLIDLLPESLWEKVSTAASERGIPSAIAAKSQPWFLALSLAIPPCAMQDIAKGQFGLDKQLMAVARDKTVPVVALEDPLETIALLSSDPLDIQLEHLALGIFDTQLAEDGLATLTALYLEGEHAASIEISRLLARRSAPLDPAEFDALFDETMETLLDQRNLRWIERIESRSETNIAIAFGAGHLSGTAGILALLKNRGYSLTRLD